MITLEKPLPKTSPKPSAKASQLDASPLAEIKELLKLVDAQLAVKAANAPGAGRARAKELIARYAESPTPELLAEIGSTSSSESEAGAAAMRGAAHKALEHLGPRIAAVLEPLYRRAAETLGAEIAARLADEQEESRLAELDFEESHILTALRRRHAAHAGAARDCGKAPAILGAQFRQHLRAIGLELPPDTFLSK